MATSADVLVALKTWWDAQAWAAAQQGPYRNLAPTGITHIRWVFKSLDNSRSETTNTSEYWKVTFDLTVFAETDAAVEEAMATVGDALDAASLFALSSGVMVRLRRIDERLPEGSNAVKRECRGGFTYEALRQKAALS